MANMLSDGGPVETLLTVKEVAKILRLSAATVYSLVRCGDLPCLRIGGAIRFDRVAVQAWIPKQAQDVNRKMKRRAI